jgi:hypothetical protein
MNRSDHELDQRLERLGRDLDQLSRNHQSAPLKAARSRSVPIIAALALCVACLAGLAAVVNLRDDPSQVPSSTAEPSSPPSTPSNTENIQLRTPGDIRPTILLGGPAVSSDDTPESISYGAKVADAVGALGLDLTLIETKTRSIQDQQIQWTYFKGPQVRVFVAAGIGWIEDDLTTQMTVVEQRGPVTVYSWAKPQGIELVVATSGASAIAISSEKIDPSEQFSLTNNLVELAFLLMDAA